MTGFAHRRFGFGAGEEMRQPELVTLRIRRKLESRRHDANDGVGAPAEGDRAPDQVRIAAKMSLPEAVAHHQHRIIGRTSFMRKKGAPDQRTRAKNVEEAGTRGDSRELYLRSTSIESQGRVVLRRGHHGFKRVGVGGQLNEQRRRYPHWAKASNFHLLKRDQLS